MRSAHTFATWVDTITDLPAKLQPKTTAKSFGKIIDVDILGHIFEQSITDLERLRNELDGQSRTG